MKTQSKQQSIGGKVATDKSDLIEKTNQESTKTETVDNKKSKGNFRSHVVPRHKNGLSNIL
ncbi:hypothetical protein [Pedobacter mucosus]|uniref:hypothetical protein n=1 Tax=Pedobacter mucosus TaxID=2895286 RepID=UPI001EE4BC44|nr:hypothetical protein [Pedobacter mucosus]UKT65708.1 hypothetical protein LOK61_07925 [Pedobacter mucosus]